jgi:hypothetical protein
MLNDFEIFYKYDTKSLTGWGKVSVIYIDTKRERYMLEIDVDERNIDNSDEDGNEYYSIEVSKEVFDMLLTGVKSKGYLKIEEEK